MRPPPLRVRHSDQNLTDGGGLLLVRRLWEDLGLGSWCARQTQWLAGFFRPSLIVEVWVALLLYGECHLDDLPQLERRGIRRLFGWTRLPDPTSFGLWFHNNSLILLSLSNCYTNGVGPRTFAQDTKSTLAPTPPSRLDRTVHRNRDGLGFSTTRNQFEAYF